MKPKNKNQKETINQPTERKSPVLLVTAIVIASILFLTACIGWGMYFLQKRQGKTKTEILQSQIATLSGIYSPKNDNTAPSGNLAKDKVLDETPSQPKSTCSTCGSSSSVTNPEEEVEGFLPPSTSEKNMGYIKKVYAKGRKNYLDIDYIQWLYGQEAEKAMREEGKCPKTGECIVLNDYYISNQNPLIRTLEIAPEVEIKMQTFNSENEGLVAGRAISLETLKSALNSDKQHYQYVPFILELSNQQVTKITEQYIP